jgi:hypothetical protein
MRDENGLEGLIRRKEWEDDEKENQEDRLRGRMRKIDQEDEEERL